MSCTIYKRRKELDCRGKYHQAAFEYLVPRPKGSRKKHPVEWRRAWNNRVLYFDGKTIVLRDVFGGVNTGTVTSRSWRHRDLGETVDFHMMSYNMGFYENHKTRHGTDQWGHARISSWDIRLDPEALTRLQKALKNQRSKKL